MHLTTLQCGRSTGSRSPTASIALQPEELRVACSEGGRATHPTEAAPRSTSPASRVPQALETVPARLALEVVREVGHDLRLPRAQVRRLVRVAQEVEEEDGGGVRGLRQRGALPVQRVVRAVAVALAAHELVHGLDRAVGPHGGAGDGAEVAEAAEDVGAAGEGGVPLEDVVEGHGGHVPRGRGAAVVHEGGRQVEDGDGGVDRQPLAEPGARADEGHPHGALSRDALDGKGASEGAPEAVRQAVGGGCQSGWGRLLSVTSAIESGTCRQGDSGWA